MKKIHITSILAFFMFIACSPGQFQQVLDLATESTGLSNTQVASGLKEALNKGISKGVGTLSALDGFYKSSYKILLPEEAKTVVDKLKFVPGFSDVEALAIEKINRAAEDAAGKAKPIFVDAIKQMSFDDAMNILLGNDDSATKYLNQKTFQKLYAEFHPVIIGSLNKFGAIDYWGSAVKAYNKVPFVKKMNPELDDYVTQKTLTALFDMVAIKEKGIRNNVSERTSDLLKKVFAAQDGK